MRRAGCFDAGNFLNYEPKTLPSSMCVVHSTLSQYRCTKNQNVVQSSKSPYNIITQPKTISKYVYIVLYYIVISCDITVLYIYDIISYSTMSYYHSILSYYIIILYDIIYTYIYSYSYYILTPHWCLLRFKSPLQTL